VKHGLDDLAAFGGPPTFVKPVAVGRPNVGDRAALFGRLTGALDRGWLSNGGPLVQEFERRVADIAGTRHCVATCNATLALQLAFRATGARGEVIVPSLTFAASAHAVAWMGLTPVFCDVDPDTATIDAKHAESLIGPRTGGIMGVHLWGRPAAVDDLVEVGRRNGLPVIFDAAHALACTWRGRRVGGFGTAEIFSFHSTKFVSSFEGGALVTDDDELAARAISMRNFGITGVDEVSYVGINAKMSEASAAMGLTSLDSLEEFRSHNAVNYAYYRAGLAGIRGVQLVAYDERELNNYQYIIIDVDECRAGLDRDSLVAVLQAENVLARRYFYPGCHMMAPYRGGDRLPHTEALAARTIALPTGTLVGAAEIAQICQLIRFAVEHGPQIVARRRVGTRPPSAGPPPSAALAGAAAPALSGPPPSAALAAPAAS
jgi:dTDP-4-amino-4,6-dideoxy-D-glucose transaminase